MSEKGKVFKGSCMCGEIQFEYTGKPFTFSLCHCKMCRKFSGSAFGAFIGIKKVDFEYTKGAELETIFSSSEWASRAFCSKCGSSLKYLYHEMEDSIFLSSGVFDDEPDIAPSRHIFVKDKSEWFSITDELPQIEKY